MKLLYISSDHNILEYDDLMLFTEMGIDWFSTGYLLNPKIPKKNEEVTVRSPINYEQDPELINLFEKINPNKRLVGPTIVNKELVDKFDVVMVNHCSPWPFGAIINWPSIKHKPVIWRTYCQQQSDVELRMQPFIKEGLKVVRVSGKEQNIKHALPLTRVIRAYVDANHYFGWRGDEKHVLSFNNFFARREFISNTKEYLEVVKDIPHKLYGGHSDNHPKVLGFLSWEDQKEEYRKARVYFALGSKPAALTYNLVEAMLTGTPTVTWGAKLGNWWNSPWEGTYEASDLISNGINGFALDDLLELNATIKELMTNDSLAAKISQNGRETILKEFSKEKVKNDWTELFKTL